MTSSDALDDETISDGETPSEDETISAVETGSGGGAASRDGGTSLPESTQAREAVGVAALALVVVAAAVAAAAPHADPPAAANAAAVTLVGCLGVAAVTPALVRIDIAERRLPNAFVGVAAGAWGVSAALLVVGGHPVAAATSLVSAVAVALVGLMAALAGGLGMGDVKLGAVLTGLASTGGPTALLGLWGLAGSLAIGVAGVRTFHSWSRRSRSPADPAPAVRGVPFGPCLLAAFWWVVLSRSAVVGVDSVVTVL